MDKKANEVSQVLKLISNKNRLLILCCLEEREYTVSELSKKIKGITMPALSQHLSQLRLAGMIDSEKKGLNVYYRLNDLRILEVMKILKDLYC
ncbi:MAG: metalloregulator ArsR/SmtB family transcription factor [Erysipelotrichales bacterium]|nr:metalloregulator ArsR/SmtB family transcription factor [Erysipelotrichales bacterium]